MRILGQIPHPQLLISVFKSNNKFILKFEIGPFEQIYKFMESDVITGFDAVSNLVNDEWYKKVFAIFDQMNSNYKSLVPN